MRCKIKIVLVVVVGIFLVYGATSFLVLELEEKYHEQILYTNHYYLLDVISKLLEKESLSKVDFQNRVAKFLETHDLKADLEHSLVVTSDGEPILGNREIYTRLGQQNPRYQMIVSLLPNGWIFLSQIPHSLFTKHLHVNSWLIIFSLSVLIGVILILYQIIQRILIRPLEKLARVTHSLVQGEGIAEEMQICAHGEMQVLAREIFALREKLKSVDIASRKFEEILSLSYLEKMDIKEFSLNIFQALRRFIKSEELHLYIYDQDVFKGKYSYPTERKIDYPELAPYLATPSQMEQAEFYSKNDEYDLYLYPLQSPKRFLGYLVIRFAAGHRLRPQDREIISFVQTRLVYAIINTEYFERLDTEKEKLHIHSSKMELMVILANELREVVEITDLYQAVCQKICDYFGFNMAFLLRYSEEEEGYRCHGCFQWENVVPDEQQKAKLLSGQPMTRLIEEIYQTGREMRIQNIAESLGADQQLFKDYLGNPYPEELVLFPVFRNRQVEGVLALDVTGMVLEPAMMGLLKIYSQIVGEEIARLDLLQEREQYVKELEVERKRLKENIDELEQTKEALASERFKRLKDNLITEFSHDMRTPLTILSGYLDLFRKNVFDQQMTERIIRTMQEETTYLISMVENLLESAKILSEGKADAQLEEVDLGHWLDHLVKAHSLYRERVRLLVAEDSDLVLVTDEGKLTKVVTNLLDNACKYSKDQVKVVVKGSGKEVLVIVKDYGIGIEESDLPRIFRKFYRVKNIQTRCARGSGLGLFIVKEYVEQLGGRVQVYSQPEEGTTFLIRLPDMDCQDEMNGKGVREDVNQAIIVG